MVSIPLKCTRIKQDQEIIFEYSLNQNRLFTIAKFSEKIPLPYDQKFLVYQESLISSCEDMDMM